ncbi:LrgB family protein [Oscillospiraceae bacterium PP1C4]
MLDVINSPLFGIVLCIITYKIGLWLNRKLHSPLVNPLLVAIALTIIFLGVTGISLDSFNMGGNVISMLLPPATTALAVSIYRQIEVLKKNFLPIVSGCLAGSVTSILSVVGLCRLFGLNDELVASLIPKSVTTPIALEISRAGGGIAAITVASVIITGIFGAVISPILIRVFRVKNPVAQGVAIGTSSHAMGTTKAIELGEIQGAMSGISIGVSGILTVVLALALSNYI